MANGIPPVPPADLTAAERLKLQQQQAKRQAQNTLLNAQVALVREAIRRTQPQGAPALTRTASTPQPTAGPYLQRGVNEPKTAAAPAQTATAVLAGEAIRNSVVMPRANP